MRLTFTVAGRTVEGTVVRAEQRCTAVVGWDVDEDAAERCRATRHAHMVGPWECGHDASEGVIIGTLDSGARAEVTFAVHDFQQWSRTLLAAGL